MEAVTDAQACLPHHTFGCGSHRRSVRALCAYLTISCFGTNFDKSGIVFLKDSFLFVRDHVDFVAIQ